MKLRSTLGHPAIACAFAFGVASCGDDDSSPVTPLADAGGTQTQSDTSESSTTTDPTTTVTSPTTTVTSPTTTANPTSTTESSNPSTSASSSSEPFETNESSGSTEPVESTSPTGDGSSALTSEDETTEVVQPCNVPVFSVFTRSDTEESWDDNDFSTVAIDSTGCPPAVYVTATWPHEEGWANADPAEANREQTHFTLDSYGASNLVDKEITATVELVEDERGPSANAGGYLVSVVSVSTYDEVVVLEPVPQPDAGPDAGEPVPQTVTQTGYKEAESAPDDRILLRHVGDRATVRFRVPMKTDEVDSYDPARVLKVNLRFYNVFNGEAPAPLEPMDAGVDASVDASLAPTVEGDPSLVYDYLTSKFAITRFTISDVAGTPQP